MNPRGKRDFALTAQLPPHQMNCRMDKDLSLKAPGPVQQINQQHAFSFDSLFLEGFTGPATNTKGRKAGQTHILWARRRFQMLVRRHRNPLLLRRTKETEHTSKDEPDGELARAFEVSARAVSGSQSTQQ